MGADFIVHFQCETKTNFGEGDALEGSQKLLAMLKARSRLEVLKEAAARTGQTTIKVVRMTPDGQQEEEISLEALEEASTPLEENKERCQGCDANVLGIPYGCVGFVPYPVRAEWETALVNRLQSVETPGGFLLASAVRDFNYDGANIKRMREAGMFEAKVAPSKVIQKKFFSSTKITGDQLFHAIFSVGGALNPDHCSMVLSFIGALEVGGRVPSSHVEAVAFQQALGARNATLKLEGDPEQPVNTLLRAMFRAWKLNVPLLMDA
ncbi:MAG: hypothetical protein JNM17_26635 [Archangium sp.]|nr:hypothetical protein [Archangium sp.]